MFRWGEHAYGIEFHPEMTLAMIERWSASERGSAMLTLPGGQPREAHLEGYRRYSARHRPLARALPRRAFPAGGGRARRRVTLATRGRAPGALAPAAIVVARLRPAVLPVERAAHVGGMGIVGEARGRAP